MVGPHLLRDSSAHRNAARAGFDGIPVRLPLTTQSTSHLILAGPSRAFPFSIPTACGTSASSRSFDSLNWKVIVLVARYIST